MSLPEDSGARQHVEQDKLIEQARMVVSRLEKLSPDSLWAWRSSGARGSLLKTIERLEDDSQRGESISVQTQQLEVLIQWGFDLLAKGARERF
ncbi:MAG: hypothetical protein PHS96_03560 [Anaerolineales bacterium]|nr:hypothetical protein [Anaerolineales bacterium]